MLLVIADSQGDMAKRSLRHFQCLNIHGATNEAQESIDLLMSRASVSILPELPLVSAKERSLASSSQMPKRFDEAPLMSIEVSVTSS